MRHIEEDSQKIRKWYLTQMRTSKSKNPKTCDRVLRPPFWRPMRVTQSGFCVVRTTHRFTQRSESLQHAVLEPAETLETALKSDAVCLLSRLTLAPDVPPSLPELLDHPLLRTSIRQTAQDDARRIYTLEMDKSLIKGAEKALSYTL